MCPVGEVLHDGTAIVDCAVAIIVCVVLAFAGSGPTLLGTGAAAARAVGTCSGAALIDHLVAIIVRVVAALCPRLGPAGGAVHRGRIAVVDAVLPVDAETVELERVKV